MLLFYWTRLQPFNFALVMGLLFFFRIFLVMNAPYKHQTSTKRAPYNARFFTVQALYVTGGVALNNSSLHRMRDHKRPIFFILDQNKYEICNAEMSNDQYSLLNT